MTGETIARSLRLRRAGKGSWNGQCPACGYKAGFAVTERRGELPLLYCHAGRCGQAELIEALGKLGLWPNHTEREKKSAAHPVERQDAIAGRAACRRYRAPRNGTGDLAKDIARHGTTGAGDSGATISSAARIPLRGAAGAAASARRKTPER